MSHARDILLGLLAVQRARVPVAAVQRAAAEAAADPASSFPQRLLELDLLSQSQLDQLLTLSDSALRAHGADPGAAVAEIGGSLCGDATLPEALADSLVAWEVRPPPVTPREILREGEHGLDVAETPGRYSEEREHALGGMGRILIAYDESLARNVVIKELRPKRLGGTESAGLGDSPGLFSRSMLQRFLQEARVTGRLEHPSIVPVYELGRRLDGTPYYSMKLVRGKTLSQAISECGSLRERMRLLPHFVNLCQAVAYAHSRGVIHRDLKPANVMVGEFGETVVIDWGLAKLRGAHDAHRGALERQVTGQACPDAADSGATAAGEILGTPLYMAPEQAAGKIDQIGERSDVYALGVILYEIITGRAPYTCTTREETLHRVLRGEPDPLEELVPNVPPDLAAVCQRAMAKAPEHRYNSARELAEEINRFLSGALVQTYEYHFSEQLVRFIRRHRKSLFAAAATFLLLLGVGVYSYVQVRHERDAAETARYQAEEARGDTELARAEATRALYGAYIALAAVHIGDANYEQARQLLERCPAEFRQWEWGRLQFLCNQDYQSYTQSLDWNLRAAREGYTLDPVRHRVILESGREDFNVLNTLSGRVTRHVDIVQQDGQLCQSPGGRWFLQRIGSNGTLSGKNLDRPRLTFDILNHWAWSFSLSGGDRTLAVRTAPERVTFFDIESRSPRCTFDDLTLTLVRLSTDGGTAAILLDEGSMTRVTQGPLVFLDVGSGEERARTQVMAVTTIDFSPAGRLVTGGPHGEVSCWATDAASPLWQSTAHAGAVSAQAFSGPEAAARSGAFVVTGSQDGTVCVMELETGREQARFTGQDGPVEALAVSPDGRLLAAAHGPRIRVWEWRSERLVAELEGHTGAVIRLDFATDGQLLYSMSRTEVKLWNLENPGATQRLHRQGVQTAALASGGGSLLTAAGDGLIQTWSLQDGACAGEIKLEAGATRRMHFNEQGTRLLIETGNGQELWDTANRTRIAALLPDRPVRGMARFSPCGRWLALCETDSLSRTLSVLLHDARTGAAAGGIGLYGREKDWNLSACALAFSPDGTRLAVTAWNRVTFYTLPGGKEKGHAGIPEQSDQQPNQACYSPDGGRLALTVGGNALAVVPVHGEANSLLLGAHTRPVTALAFDAAGERLFSGDEGGHVLIWDAISGRQLMSMPLLSGGVRFLFPDLASHTLVAGDGKDTVFARAFPWREESLPGTPATLMAARLAAHKTYDPALAPEWGACQEKMHRAEDAFIANPGGRTLTPTFPCPAGGTCTIGELGTPPNCTVHGPLANPAHLLARAFQCDALNGREDSPRATALRESLWNTLDEDVRTLRLKAARWVFEEEQWFRAARLACAKAFHLAGRMENMADTAEVDCAAALALGDTSAAISRCPDVVGSTPGSARIMPELLLTLARAGGEANLRQAFRLLCSHLNHYRADAKILEAVAFLRRAPEWPSVDATDLVGRLLTNDYESWRTLPWAPEIPEALARAAAENKYVLLVVSVSDSAAMRRLREEIFSAPTLQDELLARYVLAESDPVHSADIAEQYGLTSLPAIVVLDAGGQLLRREPASLDRGQFISAFVSPFYMDELLREWCIIGPFDSGGCAEIERGPAMSLALDFTAHHPGRSGLTGWKAYTCPRVQNIVPVSQLYADAADSVFYAYTCFELEEALEGNLYAELGELGQVWLDGTVLLGRTEPGRGMVKQSRDITLQAGRHELLLQVVSYRKPEFRVLLRRAGEQEATGPPGLISCGLPDLPRLSILVSRRAAEDALPERLSRGHDTTHITVDKRQVLRAWRENYATYLAILNPRPYMRDGKLVGIQGDNLEQIPILAEAGVRNGDILISVNGYRPGEGRTVHEIAELTEGSNPYILEVLRDSAVHTFVVHVEGD